MHFYQIPYIYFALYEQFHCNCQPHLILFHAPFFPVQISTDILLTMPRFYETSVWQSQQHLEVISTVSVICQMHQWTKREKAVFFVVFSPLDFTDVLSQKRFFWESLSDPWVIWDHVMLNLFIFLNTTTDGFIRWHLQSSLVFAKKCTFKNLSCRLHLILLWK